jgi:negative regulator of sigma E activity
MTNRPDSTSNHHPLHPRDERETLSALFDGELPGEAARFALKRLDHDAEWRETCGRWQMIGDALRGEATSAAPTGFASGVMRMLDVEAQAAVASADAERMVASSTVASSRRRWIGGVALAASVAMAAVLVVRPFSDTSAPDRQVASAPTATQVPAPSAASAPPPASANNPSLTSIAAADAPAATANHRAVRSPRTATRVVRRQATPVRNEAIEAATAVASATPTSVTTGRPFHPPVDDIVTRPWPRSVLSGDSGGALTVGFGSTSSTSPSSLYPFEPRLPESQPARPAAEPQR